VTIEEQIMSALRDYREGNLFPAAQALAGAYNRIQDLRKEQEEKNINES